MEEMSVTEPVVGEYCCANLKIRAEISVSLYVSIRHEMAVTRGEYMKLQPGILAAPLLRYSSERDALQQESLSLPFRLVL